MEKATIYTIAKAAGVSTSTVSKIVNQSGNISPETTARVMEIIRKYNYIPQQRKQQENAIGVVVFMDEGRPFASPFTAGVVNGICTEAFRAGKDVTLLSGERLSKLGSEELHCFYNVNSLTGILGINMAGNNPLGENLRESGLPLVFLANPEQECLSVAGDNYPSVCEMIDYMIGMGHEKIAYFGLLNSVFQSHARRYRAYVDTMRQHGLEVLPELVVDIPNAAPDTVRNALSRLFGRKQMPTALFFASEALAPLVFMLMHMGFKIPDDISLAGMQVESQENILQPDLAAVTQPAEAIGQRGVHLLLNRAGGLPAQSELLPDRVHFGNTVRRL